jgi:hypothetical protein
MRLKFIYFGIKLTLVCSISLLTTETLESVTCFKLVSSWTKTVVGFVFSHDSNQI